MATSCRRQRERKETKDARLAAAAAAAAAEKKKAEKEKAEKEAAVIAAAAAAVEGKRKQAAAAAGAARLLTERTAKVRSSKSVALGNASTDVTAERSTSYSSITRCDDKKQLVQQLAVYTVYSTSESRGAELVGSVTVHRDNIGWCICSSDNGDGAGGGERSSQYLLDLRSCPLLKTNYGVCVSVWRHLQAAHRIRLALPTNQNHDHRRKNLHREVCTYTIH